MAGQAADHSGGQRPRIHQREADGMGSKDGCSHPIHPTRKAAAERIYRALQPHSPTRKLNQNIFETIEEAQNQATDWLWTYNNDRPNMAIGEITPAMKLKMAA